MATDTFTYAGGTQTWTAPSAQTITIRIWGAGGGDGADYSDMIYNYSGGSGGSGGYIEFTYDAADGESLGIDVGEGGGTASGGSWGWSDGGAGESDSSTGDGGDGGGASAVDSYDTSLLVAASAGGGGAGAGDGGAYGGGGGGGGDCGQGIADGNNAQCLENGEGGDGGAPELNDGHPGGDGGQTVFNDPGSVSVISTALGGGSSATNDGKVEIDYTEPPSAPSSLSVSQGSEDQLDLSWTDNASTENGFYVYRAESSGSGTSDYSQVADLSADTTTYTDTGLEDGEQYYYRVSAYNSGGESGLSNQGSATTVLPSPSAVSVDTSTEGSMGVTWTNNDDSSDGDISVYRSVSSGITGEEAVSGLSTAATSYTDSTDSFSQSGDWTAKYTPEYKDTYATEIEVVIFNQDSVYSTDITVDVSITRNSDDTTVYSDSESVSVGPGETIPLNFYPSQRLARGKEFSSDYTISSDSNSSASISESTTFWEERIRDGETLYYTVRRSTSHTSSDSSQASGTSVLPAPSSLDLNSNIEAGRIRLDWIRNDNSPEGGYDIYRSQDGSLGSNIDTHNLSDETYADTGLEDGEKYYYTVRRYTDDTTADSNQPSATTILPSPSGTSLDISTEDEITVSWTNNDNSSDGTIEILRSTDGSTGSSVASLSDLTTTSYTDTGLHDGEKYYYTVRRSTDHATSDSSQVSGVTVLPGPSGLSPSNVTDDNADISWTVNHDYGSQTVQYKKTSVSTWTDYSTGLSLSTTSETLTGLEDGEAYDVRVLAATEHKTTEDTS